MTRSNFSFPQSRVGQGAGRCRAARNPVGKRAMRSLVASGMKAKSPDVAAP